MNRMRTVKGNGLYHPQFEQDACGIAMLANIKGIKSHTIVSQALIALERLEHRGGKGAEERLGDGAGMMTELPHDLFRNDWKEKSKQLPEPGSYGVGMMFLPKEPTAKQHCEEIIEAVIASENLLLFGWRTVPTNDAMLNIQARETQPSIRQVFVQSSFESLDTTQLERKLYRIRRKIETALKNSKKEQCYIASFSARTIVYKGLLLSEQLGDYYKDLSSESYQSAMAMVHNRFSTNTFPSWSRAQPNRFSMHNGEINTIAGNVNWMFAREATIKAEWITDFEKLRPIINLKGSDSAMFDNVLEFLVLSGWPLPQAMMMMIPEPWQKNDLMEEDKRAFYQYHSNLMEPWDGPAAMVFTDGIQIGACLDRNGLRPARYIVTNDHFIVLSSEVGVVDIPEENIDSKGRLKPGQMLLVDLQERRLLLDEEIKQRITSEQPYKNWVRQHSVNLEDLIMDDKPICEEINDRPDKDRDTLKRLQLAFGYTNEEWNKVLKPMALDGQEPIGSMGYDAPLAVLSNYSQLLFNYFKQRFAQVTNPPIDAIREELVTSVEVTLGCEGNILHPKPEDYKKIRLKTPILLEKQIEKLRWLYTDDWKTTTIPILFPFNEEEAMKKSLDALLRRVDKEMANGNNLFILSDRGVNKQLAAIPSLLAVSTVHHHLIRTGNRNKVSLIIESGEPREVHHFAALLGYGANAIYPYLVYASLPILIEEERKMESLEETANKYVKSVTKGILKIMSKMGISTIQSYIGAQIFEAIGISQEVIDRYFPRTASQIGGLTLEGIMKEAQLRHQRAYEGEGIDLDTGSDFQWRHNGETHLFHPESIHLLQQACRTGRYDLYKKYSQLFQKEMNSQSTLRGLLEFTSKQKAVAIEEVEPVESIIQRFKTGAMSFGSISQEAHEAIAIAMNRIGGRSNSGEGGEDEERFERVDNGDSKCSRIKQVASGRFGVSSHYLVNCDEIQIKMSQGAKPGEGGQLAGYKVTPSVAKTRGSIPGIELISPPPHHDIYSIEDIAQLIYDLKNVNPRARINVKLVSETGVGTIAAGVAKAKADVILISGYDGGTGAAAKSSIKHTGIPWEIGLAEAHQTLMLNGLRNRVTLETDGKLMNGRDVVIAALLGAEEFGFSTLPLVALGCVMMRVCHLGTCPVGIATQDPELRKKMVGTPEHIVNLMNFIAEEVREYMAEFGFRSIKEMVGQTNILQQSKHGNWKTQELDLSALLYQQVGVRVFERDQDHQLDETVDTLKLLPIWKEAMENGQRAYAVLPIRNTDRSVGARLGGEISRQFGAKGLPEDSVRIQFHGSAGQSFGAFIPNGVTLELEGDANDYVGKGLSGGKILIYPATKLNSPANQNIIIGNAAFYGATVGEAFICGKAGERFCVRNSGANVVTEGVGNHGCEYMTGGTTVILGEIGENFAAGMSGGIAYVLDYLGEGFHRQCNQEFVLIEKLQEKEEINLVKMLIERHLQYTGSDLAAEIIQNWEQFVSQFLRIIPKQYKHILQSIELTRGLALPLQ